MNSRISIVKCNSYAPDIIEEKLRKAINLIGGIEKFIKPQSKVLLKPNLLMAIEPESAVDTHPEVVRGVIKILKEINCKIFVGDGPSAWGGEMENVDEVYRRSGIRQVCEEEGVELVKFENNRWRRRLLLTTWLDHCEYVVNLPKFKTHDFTILTAAIKNLFGLVAARYKMQLHKEYFKPQDFSRVLVDIYEEVRPALTIVDAIVAMEGDGPATSGKPRKLNLLLAGSDGVAIDSVLALIMGLRPKDILTNKLAAARGLGIADIEHINILGEKLEEIIPDRPFQLPAISMIRKIPLPLVNLAKKFIKYYPLIIDNNCLRCGSCIKACPKQAISMEFLSEYNSRIKFDYQKCISCFCCQEACPHSAIKVKKSLLAKIVGL
ncbi:MAG: DUF362 domain-containing protein [Candidatus Omnitrophica bacterium]|nr:DUF362 domain-containing protein [Candidatus Omnitrophota bacterium]